MNLANEAGYLYNHSKELISLNRRLRSLSKKADKHSEKYHQATKEEKRRKHKKKYSRVATKIKRLIKKHDKLILLLRHHHLAYEHALYKEQKVK